MQGIHVINDPNGKPAVITIDLLNLDPAVSPFVGGLFHLLEQKVEETDRTDWQAVSHSALNRAYGDNEPDYSDAPSYTTRNHP